MGEGEFGTVHRAKWYGTVVAVKILRRSDAVAVGDFRCPARLPDQALDTSLCPRHPAGVSLSQGRLMHGGLWPWTLHA